LDDAFSILQTQSTQSSHWILGTFGGIASAVSLLNLASDAFHLQFAAILQRCLATYRAIWHDGVLERIWQLISFEPPFWFNDAVAIWLLSASVAFRTYTFARAVALESRRQMPASNLSSPDWPSDLPEEVRARLYGTINQMRSKALATVNTLERPTLIASPWYIFYPTYALLCVGLTPLAVLRLFYLKPLPLGLVSQMPDYVAVDLTSMFLDQATALVVAVFVFLAINAGLTAIT
jgi:hypothetical protein